MKWVWICIQLLVAAIGAAALCEKQKWYPAAAGMLAALNILYWTDSATLSGIGMIFLLLLLAGIQDLKTMYFSSSWLILLVLGLGIFWRVYRPEPFQWSDFCMKRLGSLIWAPVVGHAIRQRKMGIADAWCILGFALACESDVLIKIMTLSCLLAIFWSLIYKEERIPFISFMTLGYFCIWPLIHLFRLLSL